MRFQNLTRHPDIGCNCYLLETGGTRIVLDAGTHPKHTGKATLPLLEELDEDSLDAILVSHPHLDHMGGLPCLMEQHPGAAVVMTEPTRDFGSALLHNSVNVMKSQRTELNEPDYPLYSHRQVDRLERQWTTRGYGEYFSLGETERVECEFFRAGHVLGAAGMRLRSSEGTVFFTGDVHFEEQTLSRAADFPREKVDTLIVESTRGDHLRDPGYTREAEKRRLAAAIAETLGRGGSVLIPVFAFGKTQELLLMLRELFESGDLSPVPVHIGGLSTKMTEIADRYQDWEGRRHRGYSIMKEFPDLRVLQRGRSEPEFRPGRIYALSSGMMSPKTVSHRFARHILGSPQHSLFFVGYADKDTPAGHILAAGEGGTVRLDPGDSAETAIKCEVKRFDFSGHSPRDQIADYAVACDPATVLLVHGDPAAKAWFREELQARLPRARVIVPEPGQRIDL